jgi:thymidylate kinase
MALTRIAISGSHGVGKSSLCKSVYDILNTLYPFKTIVLVDNISRKLIERRKIKHGLNSELDDYNLFVTEYITRYMDATGDIIIHDRTMLDTLAYMKANSNVSDSYLEMIIQFTKWYIQDINYYFYIPIEFEMEVDGVRDNILEYQKKVDLVIKEYLEYYKVNVYTLNGNTNNRANQLIKLIGR